MAFLTPKSVTDNTSCLPRQNIKNISAVHLPIPFTCCNALITSSSVIDGNISKYNLPSSILDERSFRYSIFLLDKPTLDFNSVSGLDRICMGIGIVQL